MLQNVLKTLTAMSLMSLSATVLLGFVGALVMYVGSRQILAGALTLGEFVTFTAFLAFLAAPIFQIVGIGTQISEALAGLDLTRQSERSWRAIRGREIGFILQDALVSLDQLRLVGDEIAEPLKLHGWGTRASRRERAN